MTTVYGIKNCDSVRKTRQWLKQQAIDYQFHDFRQAGLSTETIDDWLTKIDWQKLLNKRSSSWRQLTDEQKQSINADNARALMLENPTLIKRPVIEHNNEVTVGFNLEQLNHYFS